MSKSGGRDRIYLASPDGAAESTFVASLLRLLQGRAKIFRRIFAELFFERRDGRKFRRDKFVVAPFRTADAGPVHRAVPESSAYRSRPENAPAAPIHRKKFRRRFDGGGLIGPGLIVESYRRSAIASECGLER